MSLLPITYASHGLWLLFALLACGTKVQPNGTVLPMRFKAVLYLDVYGWLSVDAQRPQLRRGPQGRPEPAGCGLLRKLRPPDPHGAYVPMATHDEEAPREPCGGHGEPEAPAPREEEAFAAAPGLPEEPLAPRPRSPGRSGGAKHGLLAEMLLWCDEVPEEKALVLDMMASESSSSSEGTLLRADKPPKRRNSVSGELREVPPHAFHPSSYLPKDAAYSQEAMAEEMLSVQGGVQPRLPAKLHRTATLLLVLLWAVGLTLPFTVFRDFMTKPLTASIVVEKEGPGHHARLESVQAMIGTAPDGLPELIPSFASDLEVPALPESEIVPIHWPSHSGFAPRALTSDPTGSLLIAQDDVGLFFARLPAAAAAPAQRAAGAGGPPAPAAAAAVPRFQAVPPCLALEGKALQDIAVSCSSARGCRIVVLHSRGRHLAECPIPEAAREPEPKHALEPIPMEPSATWSISRDWLTLQGGGGREYVTALAVNSMCTQGAQSPSNRSRGLFDASEMGCVTVGTAAGRLMQLRGSFGAKRHRLVPARAMQPLSYEVARGSLHVLPSGYIIALRRGIGDFQAFDLPTGALVGTWGLPKSHHWLTICGGHHKLLVLGLRNGTELELHSFPLPGRLRSRRPADLGLGRRAWGLRVPTPNLRHEA